MDSARERAACATDGIKGSPSQMLPSECRESRICWPPSSIKKHDNKRRGRAWTFIAT